MTINAEWPLLPLLAPFRSSPARFRPSATPFWPSLSPPNCCAAPIHRTIHPPHSLTFSQGIFKFASFKLPCIAQDHGRGYHCRPSCSRASRTTRCHRCRRPQELFLAPIRLFGLPKHLPQTRDQCPLLPRCYMNCSCMAAKSSACRPRDRLLSPQVTPPVSHSSSPRRRQHPLRALLQLSPRRAAKVHAWCLHALWPALA
jgi:hypothetical protein